MAAALIALGSNLGDREQILNDAVAQFSLQANVVVLATSRWHATKPIGGPAGQTEFLNGAVLVGTSLSPEQLHAVLRQIEAKAGRKRDERWASRTLDIDLLLYDKLVIDTPELVVPHPRMAFRRFVLEPAAEVAGRMEHPTIGWTITKLRDHLPTASRTYIAAIAGPFAAGKSTLAVSVATAVKGRVVADPTPPNTRVESPFGTANPSAVDAVKSLWPCYNHLRRWRGPFRAISDYWFDQAVCSAELALPANDFVRYVERHNELSATVLRPKLLVLLDVPPDVSWQRIAEKGNPHPPRLDWLARYRKLLLARVAAPGHGPVLRLDGTKLDEAREELVAAIQAMQ
jgi:2-amino-4-hydroxy-6-hydroxymethyldihydropteridine diphosphokinase